MMQAAGIAAARNAEVIATETPSAQPSPARQNSAGAKVLRVGFIGAGYISDWHAKAIAGIEGVQLAAICERARDRAEIFARAYGSPAVFSSLDELIASGCIDAAHVLLPPDLHFDATRKLLEAGIHVLIEKPMCLEAEQCRQLVELAGRKGVQLGVGHNFLFADVYQRLRDDVRSGKLGKIDQIVVTWNKELPQATSGPFDAWMLRDPANIMLEVGAHSAAHLLDLLGAPDSLDVRASNPKTLPTGTPFYRRWQVNAYKGSALCELHFSFVSGFAQQTVHVRGSLGCATADLIYNTYDLRTHTTCEDDFDRFFITRRAGKSLARQAAVNLGSYILSKLKLVKHGNPYGASIARAAEAFYAGIRGQEERRISGEFGAQVIQLCSDIAAGAELERPARQSASPAAAAVVSPPPRILVLGATGFIGQEVVRQLIAQGQSVRVLVRNPSRLPGDLPGEKLEVVRGDLSDPADLDKALAGIERVIHVARAHVKAWADYQRHEVDATRLVAERCLAAGVQRLVYTGTIDSHDCASRRVIRDDTPLDARIHRRNNYARAKAASEAILLEMHRRQKLPVVILRPGIVIGQGASPLHYGVGPWKHNAICQLWGRGDNPLPLVLVEETASALVKALHAPEVEGATFNIVGDVSLSGREYVQQLCDETKVRFQGIPTSLLKLYLVDMFKWAVKVLVRHPERRLPSYHDWASRAQLARFDCSQAKQHLNWQPVQDRKQFLDKGLALPAREMMG